MKKHVSFTALAIATAMSATAAQAEDVKVSGKVFFDYTSNTATGAADTTGGDISRTYLTAKSKLDDTWSVKLTFDSAFNKNSTGKANEVFLKTAQLTGKFSDAVNVKLGMIGTPWIGYEDGLNGHRFIAKSYVDTNKLDSSADAGIGAFGKVSMLNYDVVMVNGGGYGNTARSEKTDLNLRVGANLDEFMKGLTFDFGYRSGYNGKFVKGASETKNTLTQMLVTYGQEVNGLDYRAGFNMINNKAEDALAATSNTVKGQELWVRARSGEFGGYLRYESTDTGVAGAATEKRTVVAADYYASKNVILSLVSDSVADAKGVAGDKTSKTGLYAQYKF